VAEPVKIENLPKEQRIFSTTIRSSSRRTAEFCGFVAVEAVKVRKLGMTADPAILKRIRGCPFARGGRVRVRFRANGYSLFARRSRESLARLRLTGNGDEVVLLYPSHRGGWGALGDFGASAMPLNAALQCLSDNPYFLELRQTYN
jgi:hypothetical protein